jgi:hypothetical protein
MLISIEPIQKQKQSVPLEEGLDISFCEKKETEKFM